jgi:hypothetical protein
VVDTRNLVNRHFDGQQDDEDRDAEVRGEDIVGRMECHSGRGAIGESQGEKWDVRVETGGSRKPDAGEYRGLHRLALERNRLRLEAAHDTSVSRV